VELDLEITDPRVSRARAIAAKKSAKRTKHEDALAFHLRAHRFPAFEREYVFAKSIGRRWRFDFAFLEPWRIAVEVEGLVVRRIGGQLVTQGRHANVDGFRGDCEKTAWAAVLGWTVLRFERDQVKNGFAVEMIGRLFAARGWSAEG
jgi:very-short-patch-repair endonuclease